MVHTSVHFFINNNRLLLQDRFLPPKNLVYPFISIMRSMHA
jgi:hypothetical protein